MFSVFKIFPLNKQTGWIANVKTHFGDILDPGYLHLNSSTDRFNIKTKFSYNLLFFFFSFFGGDSKIIRWIQFWVVDNFIKKQKFSKKEAQLLRHGFFDDLDEFDFDDDMPVFRIPQGYDLRVLDGLPRRGSVGAADNTKNEAKNLPNHKKIIEEKHVE